MIKKISGIAQSLILLAYLSLNPIHYELTLVSIAILIQLITFRSKTHTQITTEISQLIITLPLGFIYKNISSSLIIMLQLLNMRQSKLHVVRVIYIVIFGMINDIQISEIIILCLSVLIYTVVLLFQEKKISYSPTNFTRKFRDDNELDKTDKSDKIHLQSLPYSDNHQINHKLNVKGMENSISDQFMQIFDQFPDGVALIIFDVNRNPIVDFCNQTMINLLKTSQSELLKSLMQLKDLHLMKNKSHHDLATSISTYKSLYSPEKSRIGVVRSIYRASTTVQSTQINNLTKLKFSKNVIIFTNQPFDVAMEQATIQIHSQEVQQILIKSDIAFDLHAILQGYVCGDKKKDIQVEIKLFISYLNKQPQILILTRDISYKDYIKSINQHSKAKSNSLNFVTHELRTPLSCIIQILEELDQKNDAIKTALLNCYYLLNFSNDLLDLAQIKVGKFRLHKTHFYLDQLIQQCFDLFRVQAKRTKIKLLMDYPNDIPQQIFNDDVRIKQILINLIGNAFKFTSDGTISVKVCREEGGTLILKVIDTGLGVREEDKKKLLKAFGRLEDDESKQYNRQGVGLGLLISNMICKSLSQKGSNINIESELYKGSSFSFEIDYLDEDDSENCDIEQASEESLNNQKDDILQCETLPRVQRIYSNQAFRQRELLIIDDNQFNIDMLLKLFNNKGITRVDYATNCHQALQLIEQRIQNYITYRVVLLDIEMPVLDGFATQKMIKQYLDECNINIPSIIGVSGHGMYMRNEALNNGMIDYYQKPLKMSDVETIISRYLQ